jgi:hypothetical protein
MHVVDMETRGKGSKNIVDVADDKHEVDRHCEKQRGSMFDCTEMGRHSYRTGGGAISRTKDVAKEDAANNEHNVDRRRERRVDSISMGGKNRDRGCYRLWRKTCGKGVGVLSMSTHDGGSKSLGDVDDDEHEVDRRCEKRGGGMLIALRRHGYRTGGSAISRTKDVAKEDAADNEHNIDRRRERRVDGISMGGNSYRTGTGGVTTCGRKRVAKK